MKTQGGDVASFTYVYSLTGRTRLGTMAPVPVYIPGTACRSLVDFFRPGELRILPSWVGGFPGRYSIDEGTIQLLTTKNRETLSLDWVGVGGVGVADEGRSSISAPPPPPHLIRYTHLMNGIVAWYIHNHNQNPGALQPHR